MGLTGVSRVHNLVGCRPSSQQDFTSHIKGSEQTILKGLSNFVSDCNDDYKHLVRNPMTLQADHLSNYQDIYDWKSNPNFAFAKWFHKTTVYWGK